ncbi:YNGI-like protein [Mya arenaria]|uniref:YNGI-like protein n=1 Tax=Mya arenaria TaxID=6604 RepID=A0ABY7EER6_MYAAR|nr:putative acyl-CoA synthetase YngI [Mya arenaria]WAR07634.1 YNGI-like protein [Mya arenaria]
MAHIKLTQSYLENTVHFPKDGLNSIKDILEFRARDAGEDEVIVFAAVDGFARQAVTYKELFKKSCQVARSLIALGIKPTEVVAINVRSCPEWLFFVYGAMLAGIIPVGVSFTYADGSDVLELMEKLERCALLFADPGVDSENWRVIQKLVDYFHEDGSAKSSKMPYLRYLIGHEVDTNVMTGVMSFAKFMEEDNTNIAIPDLPDTATAFLFQTSGSTGAPKLVAHSHKMFMSFRQFKMPYSDRSLILFNDRPFTWAGGFPYSPILGRRRVTTHGFAKFPIESKFNTIVKCIQQENCTAMYALPPFVHELISKRNELPTPWPVKYLLTGGQPMTKQLAECVSGVCQNFVCTYGCTELPPLVTGITKNKDDFTEFSCGTINDGEKIAMKIVDDSFNIVQCNAVGEIYLKSEILFLGYFNDTEKTSSVMTEDGWFKTDDLGRMTIDGQLFVLGRKSNMIISGGMNVAPEILERVLNNCPGVASSVIVPVPDQTYYQQLCACIVKQKDYSLTEEQLRNFCVTFHNDKPRLFTVLPKFYLFFDKFPQTLTGKVSRKALTAMVGQMLNTTEKV